jgi:SAM-dependent MidA family methyltransferase
MCVADLIKEEIRATGPLSFRNFMEAALYNPQQGYYCSSINRIGKNGDFYTSPHFTPLFGELIARQIEQMWRISGDNEFSIVEFGGGNGRLCLDILGYLKENHDLYKGLHYYIIEKSMQAGNVPFYHDNVCWLHNSDSLENISGCILSNELVDNLSVHRVQMLDGLQEIFVDFNNNSFTEVLKKDDGTLQHYLSELHVQLSPGYLTEINLDALDWMQETARILKKGFVLTIDYGYANREFYSMQHRHGNLNCYYRHTRNVNPYSHVGEQDITAHINFSALYHWGLKYGLAYSGFTTQQYFLQSLGIASHIQQMEQKGKAYCRNKEEVFNLSYRFLTDMSSKLKVLIQNKGIDAPLQCLQFNSAPEEWLRAD